MRPILPLLAVSAALLLGSGPASAASRGPCRPADPTSPRCAIWSAEVTFLADGDTLTVETNRGAERRIRVGGINAQELSRYSKYPERRRGECHALAAAARAEQLLRRSGRRVRLVAQDPASRSGSRLRRAVFVRSGGRWIDLGATLLAEGHALWLPSHTEWTFNRTYAAAAAAAAARGTNLWDPQGCGAGPSPAVTPGLRVVWDAPGDDVVNVDGEVLELTNPAAAPLPLGGWTVRDSSKRRFRLPAGTVVAPGATLRVHVGQGDATAGDLFWGLAVPAFENRSGPPRWEGDGGYLFDPRGNLRAADQYETGA